MLNQQSSLRPNRPLTKFKCQTDATCGVEKFRSNKLLLSLSTIMPRSKWSPDPVDKDEIRALGIIYYKPRKKAHVAATKQLIVEPVVQTEVGLNKIEELVAGPSVLEENISKTDIRCKTGVSEREEEVAVEEALKERDEKAEEEYVEQGVKKENGKRKLKLKTTMMKKRRTAKG